MSEVLQRIQPGEKFVEVNSTAYTKKNNLVQDKACYICWEITVRKSKFTDYEQLEEVQEG